MDLATTVAYFTMEVALEDALPSYSGGLGVLAGDYLKSAADLGLPVVAVTLLYRGGYFDQTVDDRGLQSEAPVDWSPEDVLERLGEQVSVEIDGRAVEIGVWRLVVTGASGATVPVLFLDTDLEENDDEARAITDRLYGGDRAHRLRQEAVLGLGGVEMLRRLGHHPTVFHMNEGHSSLLVLALLERGDLETVRRACAFTTHTPVPAGHDRFSEETVTAVLGKAPAARLEQLGVLGDAGLNMTELGIAGSAFVNAVSLRHREVTREMFPATEVVSVTNGVHVSSWAGPSIAALLDRHLDGWRIDNAVLRYASSLPLDELAAAHREEKRRLFDQLVDRTGRRLDPDVLTFGLARRATAYKQTTLVFSDLDRLKAIAADLGPIQILVSGKAHPNDAAGKALIARVVEAARALEGEVAVLFLEGYDLRLASLLVAGSDVWLNTPARPNEASGTSGMKAAVNGVPSLSTLDGWWVEGHLEGVTGWAVGEREDGDDAEALYEALERRVLPAYYDDGTVFAGIGRNAIALNASFFNTERMAREYARAAYGVEVARYTARIGR